MQKLQKDWPIVCAILNHKLASFEGGPNELARLAGINYFAARRFLSDRVHNHTKNAEKLCEFFEIDITETAKVQTDLLEMLTGLVKQVWDGSAAHAELLAGLIKSTEPFKVAERQQKP
ncbi:hypothetical protein EDC30_103199 [Paucimonas lemoignei]|uniref:Uncharacterized protein n=1 Tax=Paucimonas lemoignei TaxID=29443 RepID=A0A4R3HX62_PAULE|nr:hypothetical protein [Paucimonas lemoignei]TCS37907.1 hypothetical protein EDC30_103199 [Paucimonas lemoignei]